MDVATGQVQRNARKVIVLQAAVAAVVALVFGIIEEAWSAFSAVYGGIVGICSSMLLRRGVLRASEVASDNPGRGMTVLYLGAVQRFVLVLGLFGIGLAVIKIDPLAGLVAFGVAQLAYAVVMRSTAYPVRR